MTAMWVGVLVPHPNHHMRPGMTDRVISPIHSNAQGTNSHSLILKKLREIMHFRKMTGVKGKEVEIKRKSG